jgi:hypothetical protein
MIDDDAGRYQIHDTTIHIYVLNTKWIEKLMTGCSKVVIGCYYRILTMVYNFQRYWVFLLALMDLAWSQVFITRVICDIGCPVIEASSFSGTQQNRVFLHLRTETDPVSETSCFSLVCFLYQEDG